MMEFATLFSNNFVISKMYFLPSYNCYLVYMFNLQKLPGLETAKRFTDLSFEDAPCAIPNQPLMRYLKRNHVLVLAFC